MNIDDKYSGLTIGIIDDMRSLGIEVEGGAPYNRLFEKIHARLHGDKIVIVVGGVPGITMPGRLCDHNLKKLEDIVTLNDVAKEKGEIKSIMEQLKIRELKQDEADKFDRQERGGKAQRPHRKYPTNYTKPKKKRKK